MWLGVFKMSAEAIHLLGLPKKHLFWLNTPIIKVDTTSPPTSYTDVDCTDQTSKKATLILAYVDFKHNVAGSRLHIRKNGVTSGGIYDDGSFLISAPIAGQFFRVGLVIIPLDSNQIFEYKVLEYTTCQVRIVIFGYME